MSKQSITIELGQSHHLDEIDQIYNHYVLNTAITFDLEPWPTSKRQAWLNQYNSNQRHFLFVALSDSQEVIGYCTSSTLKDKAAYNKSVEVSIYLKPDQQHKGTGTLLYRRLLSTLKKQGIHRAYALITVPNPGSEQFHQKFGFELVSQLDEVGYKFDQFYDTRWFQLKLDKMSDTLID